MKNTYIIINGKDLFFVEKESMELARDTAIKCCDQSKEIIVREVDFEPISDTVNRFATITHSKHHIINAILQQSIIVS